MATSVTRTFLLNMLRATEISDSAPGIVIATMVGQWHDIGALTVALTAAESGISIPDNPMGQPRLGALESIDLRNLPVDPKKIVMNLNTFHPKSELDGLF